MRKYNSIPITMNVLLKHFLPLLWLDCGSTLVVLVFLVVPPGGVVSFVLLPLVVLVVSPGAVVIFVLLPLAVIFAVVSDSGMWVVVISVWLLLVVAFGVEC